jgi:hypothetical protein
VAATPDGCVVSTAPLARRLRDFLRRWEVNHPPQLASDALQPLSGVEWLEQETGVPAGTILNIVGTTGRGPRYRTTGLRVADEIAIHIGCADELRDGGELQPFPNPNAPAPIRGGSDGRCGCSGSAPVAAVRPRRRRRSAV